MRKIKLLLSVIGMTLLTSTAMAYEHRGDHRGGKQYRMSQELRVSEEQLAFCAERTNSRGEYNERRNPRVALLRCLQRENPDLTSRRLDRVVRNYGLPRALN